MFLQLACGSEPAEIPRQQPEVPTPEPEEPPISAEEDEMPAEEVDLDEELDASRPEVAYRKQTHAVRVQLPGSHTMSIIVGKPVTSGSLWTSRPWATRS